MLDLRLCFTCRWGVSTTPAAFFLPQIRNRLRICHTLLCAACTHGILFPQIGQRWPICPALQVLPVRFLRCPKSQSRDRISGTPDRSIPTSRTTSPPGRSASPSAHSPSSSTMQKDMPSSTASLMPLPSSGLRL